MVSNSYFLEDGEEVMIFDPSCGKAIARRIEAHIRSRRAAKAQWKRAVLIAGHAHADHAGNFYLSDVIGAPESHIYVHEKGFQDGSVKNQPVPHMEAFIMVAACLREAGILDEGLHRRAANHSLNP